MCISKEDLDKHIIENHKSYKPCRNFATNNCEYTRCRYEHIILKTGEQMCYKCGDKFSRKSFLLNHIRNNHDEPCLKYLEGNCTHGIKCVFKHTSAQRVAITPAANESQRSDFLLTPASGKRLLGDQEKTLSNQEILRMITQMREGLNMIQNQLTQ